MTDLLSHKSLWSFYVLFLYEMDLPNTQTFLSDNYTFKQQMQIHKLSPTVHYIKADYLFLIIQNNIIRFRMHIQTPHTVYSFEIKLINKKAFRRSLFGSQS